MQKYAGMESAEISDPRHQKDINVSTTVRMIFRKFWPAEYAGMRNIRLNQVIAKDFAANSSNVYHYFWIDKEERLIGEIRGGASGKMYISAIKGDSIDILTIQTSWKQPKLRPKSNIIEMDDQ